MSLFTSTGHTWKYNLKHPIKTLYHHCLDIKYYFQKANKGYSDRDLFNMDLWFPKLMYNALSDYRASNYSHPSTMSEDKWDAILFEMMNCFREASPDICTRKNKYTEDFLKSKNINPDSQTWELWSKEEDNLEKYYQENMQKGLDMLKIYIYDLWQ